MKKKNNFSIHHQEYVKQLNKENIIVWILRFSILIFILISWELFTQIRIIDPFITSSPSRIINEENLFDLFNFFPKYIGVVLSDFPKISKIGRFSLEYSLIHLVLITLDIVFFIIGGKTL